MSKKILPGQVVSVKVEPPLNIHHDQKNPAARLGQLVATTTGIDGQLGFSEQDGYFREAPL